MAKRIRQRQSRRRGRESMPLPEIWLRRDEAFPHLRFGWDVEHQLRSINRSDEPAVVKCLADLNWAAGGWCPHGGPFPWPRKVTPESKTTMRKRPSRDARNFRAHDGTLQCFEWHARCGRQCRIHLRLDAQTRKIEIGYIGTHLPI